MTPTSGLPWTYVPAYSTNTDEVRHQILAKDADGSEFVICEARTVGNAEFIALAANLYGPLVQALQTLHDMADECLGDHPDRLAAVRELLRLAKGGTP